MTRYYVGVQSGKREVFTSPRTPTEATHGRMFAAVIGPFRTARGARFMATCGGNNPHCQTVADAERLARRYEREADKIAEGSR